jgi:hypothetical protein
MPAATAPVHVEELWNIARPLTASTLFGAEPSVIFGKLADRHHRPGLVASP